MLSYSWQKYFYCLEDPFLFFQAKRMLTLRRHYQAKFEIYNLIKIKCIIMGFFLNVWINKEWDEKIAFIYFNDKNDLKNINKNENKNCKQMQGLLSKLDCSVWTLFVRRGLGSIMNDWRFATAVVRLSLY